MTATAATPATTPDPGSHPTSAASRVARFKAGASLAAVFRSYAKRFIPLTALAAFAAVPGLCLTATYPLEAAKDIDDLRNRAIMLSLWNLAIGWLPGLVVLGAASGLVVRHLRGEPCFIALEVSRATKKLWQLVALQALWLGMLAPFVAVMAGAVLMWPIVGPILSLTFAFLVGSLCVYFFLGLQVSAQAVVIEDLSPIGAMRRSQTLTKDRRFAVYGTLLTFFLPIFLAFCSVLFWFLSALPIEFQFSEAVDAVRRTSLLIAACHAPLNMMVCVLHAVIYHDLRCEKEALAAAG